MNNKPLDEEVDLFFKFRYETAMEQAIKMKFPNIKIIEVTSHNIQIEDDGFHTAQMVLDFFEELKKYNPNGQ